ncbi:NET1-associated nuclear protein 1 [Cryptotrichosporon argae]
MAEALSIPPIPSSSRLPRSKQKEKASLSSLASLSTPILHTPSALGRNVFPPAGPSKLPLAETQPRRTAEASRQTEKKKRKADRDRAGRHKPDGERWEAIPVAQSEISGIPPVWSADGRFYFTVANTSVFVHSSTAPTFTRLSTLSSSHPQGHRKPITGLVLHPTNPLQLLTSSEDGTLKVWDWVEGRLIRTTVFADDGAVTRICPVDVGGKWWVFGSVTNPKPGKKVKDDGSHLQHRVMRVPLAAPQSTSGDKPVAYLYLVGKLRHPAAALSVSPRGTYIVALAGRKAYVYHLSQASGADDKWKPTCVKFVSDQPFTCGLFAPDRRLGPGAAPDEWFATGDERGVIRLWHGLSDAFAQLAALPAQEQGDNERRLPTTSLHWHAHAVAGLAFSPSGAQLLSVGDESVLVQWHLASGRREYIPRLGGRPILSIAVRRAARVAGPSATASSEDEYWLGFADGGVTRVGAATGSVTSVGQGVRIDPLRPVAADGSALAPRPYPLAVHAPSRTLVLPASHPSTLQFIDPLAPAVLFDLEVAPSNRVSRRDDKELVPVAVERVAFSAASAGGAAAEWMATVEGRDADDAEGGGRVKTLKLWRWDGARYVVNTQFPRPHGAADVSSIAFSAAPVGVQLITTGLDTAKVWHVRHARKSEHGKTAAKRAANTEVYWSLRSTFTYRALPIHASAYAPDGTIVALAHGRAVTLWDSASNVILCALEGAVDVRHALFVNDGRHLVGAGHGRGLVVWDLLSCEVVRSLSDHPVEHLLPLDSGFLTATSYPTHTALTLFSSILSQTSAHVGAPSTSLISLPSATPHLVSISPSGSIARFGPSESAPSAAARTVKAEPAAPLTSVWQEMFGKAAFLDDASADGHAAPAAAPPSVGAIQARARGRPADVYAGASHVMPPPSMLFNAFMDELLGAPGDDTAGTGIGSTDATGERIAFVDEPTRGADASLAKDDVRAIKDADVAELEAFFRGLIAVPAASKPAPAPTPTPVAAKAKPKLGLANGHASTPRKALAALSGASMAPTTPATPATPATDADEAGSERKKTKKRKAPRE